MSKTDTLYYVVRLNKSETKGAVICETDSKKFAESLVAEKKAEKKHAKVMTWESYEEFIESGGIDSNATL